MLRILAAAALGAILIHSGVAEATDCAPHCDYVHDYGPYDFSYIRPGLFGYPVCDWRGDCSPYLIYRYSGRPWPGVTITIRPTRAPK